MNYIKMAILHQIAFLLACASFVQGMQAESSYEFSEDRITSSSSAEELATYQKEVKLVKEKTSYAMGLACVALRATDVDWEVGEVGEVGRRFMDNIALDIDCTFQHTHIGTLFALAYLSEKLIKCITPMTQYLGTAITGRLPPCIQKALFATGNYFRSNLGVVTDMLRLVYNFAKDVASCALSLANCIKTVFDSTFGSSMRIIQSVVESTQQVIRSVFNLNRPGCPDGPTAPTDPKRLVIRCSLCDFCTLHPTARMCQQQ